MKVEKLREQVGMSQREFAEHTGIPLGSLQNWERGHRTPPPYVLIMLEKSLRYDKLIVSKESE